MSEQDIITIRVVFKKGKVSLDDVRKFHDLWIGREDLKFAGRTASITPSDSDEPQFIDFSFDKSLSTGRENEAINYVKGLAVEVSFRNLRNNFSGIPLVVNS